MNLDLKKASRILSSIGIFAILLNYVAYFLNFVQISMTLNFNYSFCIYTCAFKVRLMMLILIVLSIINPSVFIPLLFNI